MVIVMDMATGKIENSGAEEAAREEFGQFAEEVLNAGWLPQPAARLEVHSQRSEPGSPAVDVEGFLDNLYRHQE